MDQPKNLDVLSSLESALEVAEAEAAKANARVESVKRAIAEVKAGLIISGPGVRTNEFQGMLIREAIRLYLNKRNNAPTKVRDELVPALVAGGAITSKDRKPLSQTRPKARYRVVLSVIKTHNAGVMEYRESDDTVWLK